MFVSAFQAGVDIGVKKNIVFRWQPPAGHDVSDERSSDLEELSHNISSYFGHAQNYIQIEGNLKIIIY